MSCIGAVLAGLKDAGEQGLRPNRLQLPSCMYRALAVELRPLLGYDARYYMGGVQLLGIRIDDAMDGT